MTQKIDAIQLGSVPICGDFSRRSENHRRNATVKEPLEVHYQVYILHGMTYVLT